MIEEGLCRWTDGPTVAWCLLHGLGVGGTEGRQCGGGAALGIGCRW